MVKTIRIFRKESEALDDLRRRHRLDCRVTFGTNESGKIWAWDRWGKHPEKQRIYVHGCSSVLDQAAGIYVELSRDVKRISGGRFFIDDDCAYWKDGDTNRHKILNWKFVDTGHLESSVKVTKDETEVTAAQPASEGPSPKLVEGMTEYQRLRLKQAQAMKARRKR
jgi:hypothetical protein